jgi:hypothetical protein
MAKESRRMVLFSLCTVGLAFAVISLNAENAFTGEPTFRQRLQGICKEMGGVLYTANDSADAPAICHKQGAPLSSEESLGEWEKILFVEGQL